MKINLSTNWGSKSVSINITKNGNNINLLRGFCDLSAFGQALFATVGNIKSKISNGELIIKEYDRN